MSLPVIAGVAIASAGAQYLNSKAGAAASAEERAYIQNLINKVQDPNFDASYLTPEDYKVVGTYIPEVSKYVEEANPTIVKAASEGAVRGRDAQMAALDKFRNLGQSGDDFDSRIARTRALRDAQVQDQGQQASIQQNMAQRGMGGSGMELVSSLLAQQGAARNASESSERAAMEAYNRKLDALRTSASMGSDIRNQDVDLETKNAGIINDYNQRFANARNDYNRYAAGTRNDAQRMNLGVKQDIANRNTAQTNAADTRNQDNYNRIQDQTYQGALDKIRIQAGQSASNQQAIGQGVADRNNMIGGLAGGAYQGMNYYQGREDRAEDREDRAKYGYKAS